MGYCGARRAALARLSDLGRPLRREPGEGWNRAAAHAASAEEVTASSEEQGASTEEMAASAGALLQAAEKLRGLVKEFRV